MEHYDHGSPERVFVVRHGERVDHVNRAWSKTAPRPHDSPLTKDGKNMAFLLGKYLVEKRQVEPSQVVLLSSPLIRCVETSHEISEGMLQAQQTSSSSTPSLSPTISIVIEEGLVEGSFYLWHDMCKNPKISGGGTKPCLPEVITHKPEFLLENHSPRIALNRIGMPSFFDSEEGSSSVSGSSARQEKKGNNSSSNGGGASGGVRYVRGGKVTYLEEAVPVEERCYRSARKMLATPSASLAGKTVICVGHGQTTMLWFNALVSSFDKLERSNASYTAFAELVVCDVQYPNISAGKTQQQGEEASSANSFRLIPTGKQTKYEHGGGGGGEYEDDEVGDDDDERTAAIKASSIEFARQEAAKKSKTQNASKSLVQQMQKDSIPVAVAVPTHQKSHQPQRQVICVPAAGIPVFETPHLPEGTF